MEPDVARMKEDPESPRANFGPKCLQIKLFYFICALLSGFFQTEVSMATNICTVC